MLCTRGFESHPRRQECYNLSFIKYELQQNVKINHQMTSIKVSSYIVKQPLTVDDSLNIYRYNRTLIKHRLHKSQLSNNTQYMITIKESIHYSIQY